MEFSSTELMRRAVQMYSEVSVAWNYSDNAIRNTWRYILQQRESPDLIKDFERTFPGEDYEEMLTVTEFALKNYDRVKEISLKRQALPRAN